MNPTSPPNQSIPFPAHCKVEAIAGTLRLTGPFDIPYDIAGSASELEGVDITCWDKSLRSRTKNTRNAGRGTLARRLCRYDPAIVGMVVLVLVFHPPRIPAIADRISHCDQEVSG